MSLAQLVTRKPRHWRLYWRHLFSPGADDGWLGALGLPDCGANRGRGPRPPHGPPRTLGPTEATRPRSLVASPRVPPRAPCRARRGTAAGPAGLRRSRARRRTRGWSGRARRGPATRSWSESGRRQQIAPPPRLPRLRHDEPVGGGAADPTGAARAPHGASVTWQVGPGPAGPGIEVVERVGPGPARVRGRSAGPSPRSGSRPVTEQTGPG